MSDHPGSLAAKLSELNYPENPPQPLSDQQQLAFFDFRNLLSDEEKADHAYNQLPDAQNGCLISTDIARELERTYAKWHKGGPPRDLMPGWELAYRYAHRRLHREIAARGNRDRLLLVGGGWAAGKSVALNGLQNGELAYEGTLSDIAWVDAILQFALGEGWKIEFWYIYRTLELAITGAIKRAWEKGRAVPLTELTATHVKAQVAAFDLYQLYRDNQNISFHLRHNLGTEQCQIAPRVIAISDIAPGGALHYSKFYESYCQRISEHFDDRYGSTAARTPRPSPEGSSVAGS